MRDPANKEAVLASFRCQAVAFANGRLTLARQDYIDWMTSFIAPMATDEILDVASGTGHLALALAAKAAWVHCLDLTEAMQAEAVREGLKRQLSNVAFKLGNAEALPYPDATFDKVTSRFAFHHFTQPEKVLAEMARVVKPNGAVFVIDLIVPEGPEGVSANHYERCRDPSHTQSLTHRRFTEIIAQLGLKLLVWESRYIEVDVGRWLDLTKTPDNVRARIAADFETEIAGEASKPTGMKPLHREGTLHFEQNWAMYHIVNLASHGK